MATLTNDQIKQIKYHNDCIKQHNESISLILSGELGFTVALNEKKNKPSAKEIREKERYKTAIFIANYLKTPWFMDFI